MAWTSRVDTVPSLQTLLQDEDEDSSSDVSVASEQSGEDMPPQSDSSYDSNEDTDDEESEESSSSESDSAARGPAAGRTWGAAQGEAVGRGQLQAAQPSPAFIKSPSGEIWMTDAPQANVVTERPGPRNLGGASSILQLFHLFISTAMMDAILLHTNEEGRRQRGNAWKDLVPMELSSAVGLLLFLGLTKSGRENVRSIWRKGPFARNLCIATMSGMRFQDILAMLRFDDKATGCQRRQNDMFAPIREIFDQFAASCRRYYSAGECVTVGEQLVPFRGRCPFWQCRPQKPVKYGIKFWLCVDVDTHYTLNIMPYLGKAGDKPTPNLGGQVVKKLMEPLFNTGRNVTCDSFFTGSEVAQELLQKGITLVGMIKPNRREVPKEIRPKGIKKRAAKSSVFLFNNDLTLVSYVPKPKRCVTLLSSMHHDKSVDKTNQKPEIINFYNKTKGGVDTVDQMVSLYSVQRTTKRWPLTVFYNIINIAAMNSYVLYCQLNPDWAQRHTRRDCYEELIMGLVRPQVELRAANPVGLRTHTVSAIQMLGFDVARKRHQRQQPRDAPLPERDCHTCPSRARGGKRTRNVCDSCYRYVCREHAAKYAIFVCRECGGE